MSVLTTPTTPRAASRPAPHHARAGRSRRGRRVVRPRRLRPRRRHAPQLAVDPVRPEAAHPRGRPPAREVDARRADRRPRRLADRGGRDGRAPLAPRPLPRRRLRRGAHPHLRGEPRRGGALRGVGAAAGVELQPALDGEHRPVDADRQQADLLHRRPVRLLRARRPRPRADRQHLRPRLGRTSPRRTWRSTSTRRRRPESAGQAEAGEADSTARTSSARERIPSLR